MEHIFAWQVIDEVYGHTYNLRQVRSGSQQPGLDCTSRVTLSTGLASSCRRSRSRNAGLTDRLISRIPWMGQYSRLTLTISLTKIIRISS